MIIVHSHSLIYELEHLSRVSVQKNLIGCPLFRLKRRLIKMPAGCTSKQQFPACRSRIYVGDVRLAWLQHHHARFVPINFGSITSVAQTSGLVSEQYRDLWRFLSGACPWRSWAGDGTKMRLVKSKMRLPNLALIVSLRPARAKRARSGLQCFEP